jgi:hypothetical protein
MSNVIDSALLVDAMRGAVIGTLEKIPTPLKDIFILDATTAPVQGGKAEVPFVNTENVAARTYTGGLYTNDNVEVDSVTVSIADKYFEFNISGYETQTYGIDAAKTIVSQLTKKMVAEIEASIFGIITSDNFANKEVVAAANVSSQIVGTLRTKLAKANVIDGVLVLEPDAADALITDLEDQVNIVASESAVNGIVARHKGLRVFESNNMGDLTGFAAGQDAVVIKNVGCYAEAGLYDVIETFQDAKTGLVFNLIKFANPSRGGYSWRLVWRGGAAVGNSAALYRLADA